MIEQSIYSKAFRGVLLSSGATLVYLIYLFIRVDGVYFSLSFILMSVFGAIFLSVFGVGGFLLMTGKHAGSFVKLQSKISGLDKVLLYEVCIFIIANTTVFGLLLQVNTGKFRSFLGELFFVRLEQYFPLLLLFAFFSFQIIYLFASQHAGLLRDFRIRSWIQWGRRWMVAEWLFICTATIYFVTSLALGQLSTPRIAYFPELAEAFLQGRLYLTDPLSTKDLTLFDGKYYVSFPPLGAFLMMPIVAVAGVNGVNTTLWTIVTASFGIMFIFLALERMSERGWTKLTRQDNFLLALFFGFGTVQYFMAIRGPVYYISQTLTAVFLSIALWVGLGRFSASSKLRLVWHAFLTGAFFSVALLARPNVVFAFLAFCLMAYQILLENNETYPLRKTIVWGMCFLLPVSVVLLGLMAYNNSRFGSPLDFGYRYMLVVSPELIENLQMYGQFHPHYIFRNIYDNFLRLPYWDASCRIVTPSPNGMSIFIVSPLIIYLYRSIQKKVWVWGVWGSIFLILSTHLLYFNSGALQFGYRFSLDFMPLVVLLLAIAFRERLTRIAYALIASSFLINFIGILWITRRWCENW